MTEQHCECDLKLCPDGAYCAWAGCSRRLSGNEVERRLNEYETLIAEVAGMRDKWTPPDEVAKLESHNTALLEALEEVSKWLSHVDIPYTVGYQVRKAIRKASVT